MKKGILLLLAFAAVFTWNGLMAQEDEQVIVIQKIKNDDGSVTTVKKRVEKGEKLDEYLKELGDVEGRGLELHFGQESDDAAAEGEGETIFFFRESKDGAAKWEFKQEDCEKMGKDLEELKIIMHDDGHFKNHYNYNFNWDEDGDSHPRIVTEMAKKTFLGVYSEGLPNGEGVRLSGIVAGSGAAEAGLQEGDILLSLGGIPTNGEYGLRGALSQLQPGQEVKAELIRNEQPLQLQVTLGHKEYARRMLNDERDPCDVFIGVYVGGTANDGKGVQVSGIIGNTPAEASGVLAGDVILSLDGVAVNDNDALLVERDKHNPGDAFTLSVLRNGQVLPINARFKTCEEGGLVEPLKEEEALVEQIETQEAPQSLINNSNLELFDYSAYPNPTYGEVNVRFEAEALPTNIQLIDISGRVIYEEQLNQFDGYYNQTIDLKGAVPGNITLSIQQGEKIISKVLVLLNRA